MRRFGIDVEEVDQWEVVRRSALVPASAAAAGREWLEKYSAGVHYDGDRLTPEILERQVRSYYALKEIIAEGQIDFCGIKGQPELTNNFATADIAEAFLNDPYDWDGPKAPVICATEDDMDGALTMQLMHKVTGTPVLVRRRAPLLSPTGASGTWKTRASTPPGSRPAPMTRPRTSPRSTLYPKSSTSRPAGRRSITWPPPATSPWPGSAGSTPVLPHAGHPGALRDLRRRDQ